MKALDKIKAAIADADAKIQNEGKAALAEAFADFFAAEPTVRAVRWSQYTPYFNDGDECRFGVNDFTYAEVKEKDADYGAFESDEEEFLEAYGNEPVAKSLMKFQRDLGANLRGSDTGSIFKRVFGDHVEVTATREGFAVEEYEHE